MNRGSRRGGVHRGDQLEARGNSRDGRQGDGDGAGLQRLGSASGPSVRTPGIRRGQHAVVRQRDLAGRGGEPPPTSATRSGVVRRRGRALHQRSARSGQPGWRPRRFRAPRPPHGRQQAAKRCASTTCPTGGPTISSEWCRRRRFPCALCTTVALTSDRSAYGWRHADGRLHPGPPSPSGARSARPRRWPAGTGGPRRAGARRRRPGRHGPRGFARTAVGSTRRVATRGVCKASAMARAPRTAKMPRE